MDPFDHVTPIGTKRPGEPRPAVDQREVETARDATPSQPQPAAFRLSREERQARRLVNASNRGVGTGHEPERDLSKRHRDRLPRAYRRAEAFTADEVMSKVTTLGRKFYAIADDETEKAITRKYAVTSFSTLVDKWTIVSGRPTQIIAFADGPRPGALELAARLAEAASGKSA